MPQLHGAGMGNARPEDVEWLSTLSDSELDFLISLKQLAVQRAKVIRQDNLGDKFDVKMLHAIGLIMMEYVKERVKDSPAFSSMPEASSILNKCCISRIIKPQVEEIDSGAPSLLGQDEDSDLWEYVADRKAI